ncbi:MAG TPA: UDP-N-acetylglucosamine--N-acetylmuramyl-(pentapeptide) pyrophosphoryl-undecaprenol N-acetylglucosamine transferase [Candidatus Saccharimonadales bacterium]|nr:UDP-N-acetylglucosamine--N-acetylmuramyl-(pentapeptide) pyrophosphoryl-undecaprenol N-acetylglucosamine transferase [Candidatus Saccharimonadales bacterium]
MRIAMTGGGSGGHITPLLAVAHELKRRQPEITLDYIGQRGDSLGDIPAQDKNFTHVYTVSAGKFRRYHGENPLRQLLDVKTVWLNVRDIWRVFAGYWQSVALLRKERPDVIFVKGGFVGVPVGLAAATLRIPYITHDSDALPGLANRIIARWARLHAVALPKEIYSYPPQKTETVGVPVSHQYHVFSADEQRQTREQLGLPPKGQIILITGGGLGAQRMNVAVADCVPAILERYPHAIIVHVAGRNLEDQQRQWYHEHVPAADQHRVIIKGFITNMAQYSGVADIVITRAGATSMAEFGAQAKACIVVPNPLLTGGHQIKNAQVLARKKAIMLLPEDRFVDDHGALMPLLVELLDKPTQARAMANRLHELTPSDATERLAMVLLEQAAH